MTQLRLYSDADPAAPQIESSDFETIQSLLGRAGIQLERWHTKAVIESGADTQTILDAYAEDIERLKRLGGYQTVDVVSMVPSHPEKDLLRQKFLDEHTHHEDEVRFFVDGQGLFSLHVGEQVYEVLCTRGDLISVPAGTPHWFDMGPNPRFTAIRLFDNPEGWVAHFTGSDIARQYSRLDN
ncbi:MAG: 1,2-dihydroxy-3-keto-5-methylthiopentene dioxygenase [Wenzhouxiangella sp.]